MAYNKRRPIGLTLPDDDLARLAKFAEAHDWKVTHAARVIIRDRLRLEYPDAPEAAPRGLASCGHPANEDGECDCSSWPERAPLESLEPSWP